MHLCQHQPVVPGMFDQPAPPSSPIVVADSSKTSGPYAAAGPATATGCQGCTRRHSARRTSLERNRWQDKRIILPACLPLRTTVPGILHPRCLRRYNNLSFMSIFDAAIFDAAITRVSWTKLGVQTKDST